MQERRIIIYDFEQRGAEVVQEQFVSQVLARAGRSISGSGLVPAFANLALAVKRKNIAAAEEARRKVLDQLVYMDPSYSTTESDLLGQDKVDIAAAANFLVTSLDSDL